MALGQPKQSGWLWDSKFAIQWTSGAVPKVSGWPWDIRMSMRQPLATPKPSGHRHGTSASRPVDIRMALIRNRVRHKIIVPKKVSDQQ